MPLVEEIEELKKSQDAVILAYSYVPPIILYSVADSITGAEVRELKEKYPDYSFLCYINTTAEVKAECDV